MYIFILSNEIHLNENNNFLISIVVKKIIENYLFLIQ